jgi:predicted nuclease with TOPRIM domain
MIISIVLLSIGMVALIVTTAMIYRDRESLRQQFSELSTLKFSLEAEKKKITGHNGSLKNAIAKLREQSTQDKNKAEETIKQLREELVILQQNHEKLASSYEQLVQKTPGFNPRSVRWSGPGGARELAEAAARGKSNSQEKTANAS